MSRAQHLIPLETIERRIYVIRDHKVMMDRDLAELYGVKAIALRQQVKRNIGRFPKDFMFQLHDEEVDASHSPGFRGNALEPPSIRLIFQYVALTMSHLHQWPSPQRVRHETPRQGNPPQPHYHR